MAQPAKEVTSQPSLEFELTMGVPAIGMQLQNLNMPHLVDAFRMEGVDAATLQGADKNDLVELGATSEEAEIILAKVKQAKDSSADGEGDGKQADEQEGKSDEEEDKQSEDSSADGEAEDDEEEDAPDPRHTQSEAEEAAFMRKVKAVRRSKPRAVRIGTLDGGTRDRFSPADDDDFDFPADGGAALRKKTFLKSVALAFATETTWEEYHKKETTQSKSTGQRVTRDSIPTRLAYDALCTFHQIERALANGSLRKLVKVLPDTDDIGQPMAAQTFRSRWQGSAKEVLKHLWKQTEGEVAELDGGWQPCWGDRPEDGVFFAQQFSLDATQWVNKGKGMFKSADGDYSTRAISFRPGDYPAKGRYTYAFRRAWVITWPKLMFKLGDDFTAAELWGYYKSLPLLAVRRQHSWASELRQAAARYRHKEYGHWGHRR